MPLENSEDTLDPAHNEDQPASVVAGRPTPDGKPAADDFKVSDDENIVERGGRKYVREEALHQEREKAQKMSRILSQLEPHAAEIEEFLKSKADGARASVSRAGAGGDDEDYSTDELEGMAIVRGYYTDGNKPDTNRARQELNLISTIADRRAGRVVQPVADANARDRAQANHAAARTRAFVDGDPISDPKYVDAVFEALPDQYKADPFISNLSSVIAAGLEYLDLRSQGKAGRRVKEPGFREGGGGPFNAVSESLDALDRAAARARGKTPEEWAKTTRAVAGNRNSGTGGTVLEEV